KNKEFSVPSPSVELHAGTRTQSDNEYREVRNLSSLRFGFRDIHHQTMNIESPCRIPRHLGLEVHGDQDHA
ncbi:hypothetical protein GOP47_0009475, partial [Adiantum capillus-veneris]